MPTSIEPDKETFQKINIENITLHNTTFQHWLEDNEESVDFLVNSHTFYHFKEEEWSNIFQEVNNILTPNGYHVIIVDSKDSSLSKIKLKLDKKIKNLRPDAVGKFMVGEDLERFFYEEKIMYSKKVLPSPLYFKDDKNVINKVCYMLGFVMRYDPNDIKKYAENEVKDYINQYKKKQSNYFHEE